MSKARHYMISPEWPVSFPFSLGEVKSGGEWISGDVLRFIWGQINAHSDPLTGIKDRGAVYAVALEINSVFLNDPPYPCWNL